MFTQQTSLSSKQTIKVYLRLKDKKSFLVSVNQPIRLNELKQMIIKKTKIPNHDLIVMYQGKQIDFQQKESTISLKDHSILHIINLKNVRNDFIEISVKFILRNQTKTSLGQTRLVAKSEDSIQDFIHSKIIPVLQQISGRKVNENDMNLVSGGSFLKKNFNFSDYLIEDGAEIICMINQNGSLERLSKNIPTPTIIVLHQQNLSKSNKVEDSQKDSLVQLTPSKKKSQIEKKPSLALSQNRSIQFVKLQTFESKHELAEKQRLLNEALQIQGHGSKLKKKEKITSDLARKFQHQHSLQNQYQSQHQQVQQKAQSVHQQNRTEQESIAQFQSMPKNENTQSKTINQSDPAPQVGDFILITNPQKTTLSNRFNKLALNFSKFLNKNILDDWQEEPDSPIQVEYPKVQRRGPSMVEWDPTIVSQNIEERSNRYMFSENLSEKENEPGPNLFEGPALQIQVANKTQEAIESQFVRKGDFLILGSLTNKEERKTSNDFIQQLSQRFNSLIHEKYGDSQCSSISVEYPQLQKRAEPKAGDFILCGDISMASKKLINPYLVSQFQELIEKINRKRNKDYQLNENPTQTQGPKKDEYQNEINPEKLEQNQKEQNLSNESPSKLENLESELQIQNQIKLGDFLAIKNIDFTIPKSKLLDSILAQYSHITNV